MGGEGKPGSGGLMMTARSSPVSLNEQFLTKALITVVGLGRGSRASGKLMKQQSLSSEDFVPATVPHNF